MDRSNWPPPRGFNGAFRGTRMRIQPAKSALRGFRGNPRKPADFNPRIADCQNFYSVGPLPSNSRRGLRALDPANPSSEKMTSQPTFFLLHVLPQSVRKLHRLFNISTINTHFDMFWKIKACMGVIYFLVCVRKHESNLPTNMHTTVGKKTQWCVLKCNLLSETTLLPYFMTAWCVSFYQSVHFFTNGVYHVFHHNSMLLWFL